jgi:hypothetical protein
MLYRGQVVRLWIDRMRPVLIKRRTTITAGWLGSMQAGKLPPDQQLFSRWIKQPDRRASEVYSVVLCVCLMDFD